MKKLLWTMSAALLAVSVLTTGAMAQRGKVAIMSDGSFACMNGGAMISGPNGWQTASPTTAGASCSTFRVLGGGKGKEPVQEGSLDVHKSKTKSNNTNE